MAAAQQRYTGSNNGAMTAAKTERQHIHDYGDSRSTWFAANSLK